MRRLTTKIQPASIKRRPRRARPGAEALEGRALLTGTLTWQGDVNAEWGVAANWAENRIPTANDDLDFTSGSNTSHNGIAGTLAVHSMIFSGNKTVTGNAISLGAGGITVNSGEANLNLPITLGGFNTDALPFNAIGGQIDVSSNIGGVAGIRKLGAGSLLLRGNNNYDGRTLVDEGQLRIESTNALGDSGTAGTDTVVAAGARIVLHQTPNIPETLTLSDGSTMSTVAVNGGAAPTPIWSGPITLIGNPSIDLSTPGQSLRIDAKITGSGGFAKKGSGRLTLGGNADNTFAGTLVVDAGRLDLDKGAVGANRIAVPGTLVIDGATVTLLEDNQIADDADVTIVSGDLDLNNHDDKIGTLTLTDSDVETGTGLLSLQRQVGSGSIRTLAAANPSRISGRLNLSSIFATAGFAIDVADGTAADDLEISAVISGNRGLIKQGDGALRLSGANTFSAGADVSQGVVKLANVTGFGTNGGAATVRPNGSVQLVTPSGSAIATQFTITGDGPTDDGAIVVPTGGSTQQINGTVTLSGESGTFGGAGNLRLANVVLGQGQLRKVGSGTLRLTGTQANTYEGGTTVLAGLLELDKTAGIDALPRGLHEVFDATLRLVKANQIDNEASVTVERGTFDLGANGDSIDDLTLRSGIVNAVGDPLRVFSDIAVDNGTGSSSFILGNLDLGGFTVRVTVADGTQNIDLFVSGTVGPQGTGAGTAHGFDKLGPGTMRLAGASSNTSTGQVALKEGTLQLAKSSGRALEGSIVIGNGQGAPESARLVLFGPGQMDPAEPVIIRSGTFDLNGNDQSIASLDMAAGRVTTGAGTLSISPDGVFTRSNAAPAVIDGKVRMVGIGATTFTVQDGAAAADLIVNAVVSGPNFLVKREAGTMVFNGSNTYSNSTRVEAGTLRVNGSQPTNPIAVLATATLGGTGSTGKVTILGGTLDPGAEPSAVGTMNIVGGLLFDSSGTSRFLVDIDGPIPGITHDQVNVVGAVNLVTGATLVANPTSFTPDPAASFVVIANDTPTDAVQGQFANSSVIINGVTLPIRKTGNDGNDVVLGNAVPRVVDEALTERIKEGGLATLTGRLVDADALDVLSLDVDWGDGSALETFTPGRDAFAISHRFLDESPAGGFQVKFSWRDELGASNSETRSVIVDNVAPVFPKNAPPVILARGGRATFSAPIGDAGSTDATTVVVDWGDGSAPATIRQAAGQPNFSVGHKFRKKGAFLARLRASDDDGGTSSSVAVFLNSAGGLSKAAQIKQVKSLLRRAADPSELATLQAALRELQAQSKR